MDDWMFASGGCVWRHDFARRERVDFVRGKVNAFMEQTQVFPGIWLYRAETDGPSGFRMVVEGPADQGRLILGSMLSGSGTLSMHGCDDQNWREEGRFYALTPVERRVEYDVRAHRHWQVVALRLEEQALDLLGDDDGMPAIIAQALSGKRDGLSQMATLTAPIRTQAQMLMRPPYGGTMGRLYTQSRVLEMLAHQFDLIGEMGRHNEAPSSQEQRRLREARERLLADMRDPPDLDTLAAAVGLTPRRLNRGFRLLYGATVFEYLRDARLDAARDALEAGTALPLKQLAWTLGYNQASNFVTAFRRRFAVPPGEYRRVREKAD